MNDRRMIEDFLPIEAISKEASGQKSVRREHISTHRLGDLSKQTATRILDWSLLERERSKIAWILSREYGIAMAEIAGGLGVCTSAIAKAIPKMEGED
jgi:hypothetical protein